MKLKVTSDVVQGMTMITDKQMKRLRVSASPWMRHIVAVHNAVKAHERKGRLYSAKENQTTAQIVHTATELSELVDEIVAGDRDELGYEKDG